MQGDEFRHIVLAMLVTAIFFLLFVFDAIIRENAFGLLASMVMAACVAGRVVYYVVRTPVGAGLIFSCLQQFSSDGVPDQMLPLAGTACIC